MERLDNIIYIELYITNLPVIRMVGGCTLLLGTAEYVKGIQNIQIRILADFFIAGIVLRTF